MKNKNMSLDPISTDTNQVNTRTGRVDESLNGNKLKMKYVPLPVRLKKKEVCQQSWPICLHNAYSVPGVCCTA